MKHSISDICVCPKSGGELVEVEGGLWCEQSQTHYEIRNDIPILLPDYLEGQQKSYLENYNQIAADDLQNPFEARRDIRHKSLRDFIGTVHNRRVLDIGSSNAIFLTQLQAEFKVAVDIAYAYLAAIPQDAGIIPICGDAEFLPFKSGFFDVIIISDVLEHVLDPAALIERLAAISERHTRIIVHVPWEEDIAPYKDSKYKYTHLRSFTDRNFSQLWQDRFTIKRVRKTYPSMEQPFVFRLRPFLPTPLYKILLRMHDLGRLRFLEKLRWRFVEELPRHERWLLWFYPPKFKMFELQKDGN